MSLEWRGMISSASKRLWSKLLSGPVGIAIFAGQLGQIEIKYLNARDNRELDRTGMLSALFTLRCHRMKLLSKISDLKISVLNKSGLFSRELWRR